MKEKVEFKDRFGNEVKFKSTKRKWDGQRPDETFITSLVRCFYPRIYRRNQKLRK